MNYSTIAKVGACLGLLYFLFLACVGFILPFDIGFALLFGWVVYLFETLPQISVSVSGVLSAVICLGLLGAGLHAFLSWFYRSLPQKEEDVEPRGPWQVRWTASLLGLFMLMFVAGTATVGFAHQTAWLVTSPEPLVTGGIRNAAYRAKSQNNVKQIAIAVHDYASTYKDDMPPGAIFDKDGQALHGWMTVLLPHVEQDALYKQLDLQKPWTDERNAPTFKTAVRYYESPFEQRGKSDGDGFALAHYATNVHLMGARQPFKIDKIPDGTSNTLLLGEVATEPRPWGHPLNWRDPMLGLNRSPHGFGSRRKVEVIFALADGSVRSIRGDIAPEVLKALSTPDGGETVGDY